MRMSFWETRSPSSVPCGLWLVRAEARGGGSVRVEACGGGRATIVRAAESREKFSFDASGRAEQCCSCDADGDEAGGRL